MAHNTPLRIRPNSKLCQLRNSLQSMRRWDVQRTWLDDELQWSIIFDCNILSCTIFSMPINFGAHWQSAAGEFVTFLFLQCRLSCSGRTGFYCGCARRHWCLLVAQVNEADVKLCPLVFVWQRCDKGLTFQVQRFYLTSLAEEFTWMQWLEERNLGRIYGSGTHRETWWRSLNGRSFDTIFLCWLLL